MAAELVEKYAPDAPDGVKLEAAMRCVGWWTQSAAFPVSSRSFGTAGSVDYADLDSLENPHNGVI